MSILIVLLALGLVFAVMAGLFESARQAIGLMVALLAVGIGLTKRTASMASL